MSAVTAVPAPARLDRDRRHALSLVWHLARREISIAHRFTLLGWTWPLARQLAQLAVLVFAFSKVLDLGIRDYPLFVFSGLVVWTWFATGINSAAGSILGYRHLVNHPGFPSLVLPLVAIVVPLVDVLIALPLLALLLVVYGELHASALLLPLLLAVQLVLMAGVAVIVAAASVFLRDVPNLVGVASLLAFYVTPIFFAIERAPSGVQSLLRLNPMAVLIEADRAVLLDQPGPGAPALAAVVVASVALLALGIALFRRLAPGFHDEL